MVRAPPFSTSAMACTRAGFSWMKSADSGSSFVWTIQRGLGAANGGCWSWPRGWAPGTCSPAFPAAAARLSPSCCHTQARIQISVSPSPMGPIAHTPTWLSPSLSSGSSSKNFEAAIASRPIVSDRSEEGKTGTHPLGGDQITLALVQRQRIGQLGVSALLLPPQGQDAPEHGVGVRNLIRVVRTLADLDGLARESLGVGELAARREHRCVHGAPHPLGERVVLGSVLGAELREAACLVMASLCDERVPQVGGRGGEHRPLAHLLERGVSVVKHALGRLRVAGEQLDHDRVV